jgi:hypothetical protein
MHKSGLLDHTEYKSPDRPEGKKGQERAKPRKKPRLRERGFVRRASGPTRNLSSPCATADEKGGEPVPNRDETHIKYNNPARVHAMLKKPISTNNQFHQFGIECLIAVPRFYIPR